MKSRSSILILSKKNSDAFEIAYEIQKPGDESSKSTKTKNSTTPNEAHEQFNYMKNMKAGIEKLQDNTEKNVKNVMDCEKYLADQKIYRNPRFN